jgi:hypothetical protein
MGSLAQSRDSSRPTFRGRKKRRNWSGKQPRESELAAPGMTGHDGHDLGNHSDGKNRAGPVAAIIGPILLVVGTWLHPMTADPNVALAAFTEYAASPHWLTSHLLQLAGVVLIVGALVALGERLATGPATRWAHLAKSAAVASLAVAAALQAVDGIALKRTLDRWFAATSAAKMAIFEAAFGVRQTEIGLAAVAAMIFGLAALLYGIALIVDRRRAGVCDVPQALGYLAVAAGILTALAGIAIADQGFSDLAMTLNLAGTLMLLLWLILLGVRGWRRPVF